jgi:transposase
MGMPKGQKVDLEQLRQRQLQAGRLLDQGLAQAEVARRLQVSRQSVSRWAKRPKALLGQVQRAGRKGRLSVHDKTWLKSALLRGAKAHGFSAEVWTLPRVCTVLAGHTGVRFSTVHVWRLLRQLGFSCQQPAGRARERNATSVQSWKQTEWPRLKKKP